ncbi:CBN-ASP-4 protein, partial [Aphelenchoides avenae]
MDRVANAIGADPDPSGIGLYTVKCENRTKLPPVKFNVGQRGIWVPQEDYVLENEKGDECVLIFVSIDYPDHRKTSPWLFGIPVLSRYCPLFEFLKGRVGFSEVNADFG